MKSTPLKNIGDPYEAVEFNRLVSQELQKSVLSSGQALDEFDEFQLGKAMAVYAAAGDFYAESGGVNAYVLSPVNIQQAPPSYTNGLRARFVATNTNSSNSTVNLNGLGIKSIKENGIELVAGRIVVGKIIEIQFLSAGDEFELVPLHPNTSSVLDLTTTGIEVIGNMTFDDDGHAQNVITRNLDSATTSDPGVIEKSDSGENTGGTATDVFPDVAGVKEMIDTHSTTLTSVINTLYPVGTIYKNSTDSTNPGTLFGVGTWIVIGAGRMLLGVGTGGGHTITQGQTGGAIDVALIIANLAAHNHTDNMREDGGNSAAEAERGSGSLSGTLTTNNTGSGTPFSILNPFVGVNRFERIA